MSDGSRVLCALVACLVLKSVAAAAAEEREEFVPFDASRYSQEVTECDRLASHPDDPYRVAPGRTQAQIAANCPAAIAACERAVEKDPDNPRLRYQLSRVYGCGGEPEKALPNREAAVAGNYPQALFVEGLLYLTGRSEHAQNLCRAAVLLRASALHGRLAGQVGFVRYSLQGLFDDCDVPQDQAEMLGLLAAARQQSSGDYYQTLLIDVLEEQVQARR